MGQIKHRISIKSKTITKEQKCLANLLSTDHESITEEIICLSGNNTSKDLKAKEIVKQFNYLLLIEKNLETTALTYDININENYVNIKKSLESILFKQVEILVRPLFGINGMKIIKYLSDKGARELKEISEACMIHLNQVRKLLYQLMKINIVRMLDITHKNDLNNLRTTTIWEFNFEYLKNNISELTYLTILNILICYTNKLNNMFQIIAKKENVLSKISLLELYLVESFLNADENIIINHFK